MLKVSESELNVSGSGCTLNPETEPLETKAEAVPISSSDQGEEGSGMPGKMRITHKLFQPNRGAYDEWVRLQVSSLS